MELSDRGASDIHTDKRVGLFLEGQKNSQYQEEKSTVKVGRVNKREF
jgi:hypothetical protein